MRRFVYLVRYGKRCDVYPDADKALKRRDMLRAANVPTAYVDQRVMNLADMENLLGRSVRPGEWESYKVAFADGDD